MVYDEKRFSRQRILMVGRMVDSKQVDHGIEVFDGIGYPIDNPKQMVPNRTYNLDYLLFLP